MGRKSNSFTAQAKALGVSADELAKKAKKQQAAKKSNSKASSSSGSSGYNPAGATIAKAREAIQGEGGRSVVPTAQSSAVTAFVPQADRRSLQIDEEPSGQSERYIGQSSTAAVKPSGASTRQGQKLQSMANKYGTTAGMLAAAMNNIENSFRTSAVHKQPTAKVSTSGDGTMIRNATAAEKKEADKLKSKKLSELGINFHIGGLNDVNKKAFYEKFGNKTADELTNKEVGSMVVNGWVDLEEIKAQDPTVYMNLLSKYRAYTGSDDVRLDHQIRLGAENTARSAVQALEATGRGVVNTGAAIGDFFIEDKEKSNKITEFIKKNQVSGDIDDKYKYMPEGLKTATDILGSSAQLVPVIGLSAINPALGMGLIGTSSFGNSYSSALSDGASKREAFAYGVLNAAAEIAVEKFAGGVPGLGKGAMTKATTKLVNSFSRSAMQKLVRVGLEAGGEGFEEVISYLLEPVFKKVTYAPESEIDYTIEEAAYNFLGGFAGSAIFGGGAVILGFDNDPSPAVYADATKAVEDFAKSAFHRGINHADTQKLLAKAEKAVKNASYYDSRNNAYMVPENLAEIFNAGKSVKANPNSAQSAELVEMYSGVGNTQVVKNDVFEKLVADKKISRREAAAMNTLAYDFGVNIEFVNNLTDDDGTVLNGEYSADGKTMKINANSADPLFTTVLHESVHALRRGNPEAFAGLSSELKNLVGSNTSEFSKAFKAVQRSYSKQMTNDAGVNNDIVNEEFTSFMLSYLLDNPKMLKSLARKNMNTVQKIADSVLGWFDGSIERYKNMDSSYQGTLRDAVAKLQDKKDNFFDVFEESMDGYFRFKNESNYSLFAVSDIEKSSIKEQMSKYLDVLNSMEPVDDVTYDAFDIPSKDKYADYLMSVFKAKGYSVDRKDFGVIELDKDSLNTGLNYINTPGEYAACLAFHKILKRGIEIHHRDEHKRSGLATWTFAAPVMINGQRANVAIVVKRIKGNRYKTHRVVSPDGGRFILNRKKEAVPTTALSVDNNAEARAIRTTPKNSISQNRKFDNKNITENAGNSLDNVHNADDNLQESIPQSASMTDGSDTNVGHRNSTAFRVYAQARSRYGLANVEDYSDVSFARADIDARNGRDFHFEDNTVPSEIKDKLNNSLHLSDNIVFERGEGANVEYGTGRILYFDEGGNVVIAVDSGNVYANTLTVEPSRVMFVSHNDENTISRDFSTSDYIYERAKNTFDNFLRTGDLKNLEKFSYNDSRYYLISSTGRLRTIAAQLKKHSIRDDGINASHISNTYSGNINADPYDYDLMSANDLLIRFHEAVTDYNLAKEISDLYIASGAEVLDVEPMVRKLHDTDRILPGQKRTALEKNRNSRYFKSGYASSNALVNGSYQFNDVYRNFQRVFREHFDVVKPMLDNLDRSKGEYARNLMSNADKLLEMCTRYNFEPGDDFDRAIQWYGEKNIHLDLSNEKDKKLFKELGFDAANYPYSDEIDVSYTYQDLVKKFGEARAAQVAECAGVFREMYDDYLKRANDTIAKIYPGQTDRLIKPRRDYFRHFREVSDDLFSLGFALTEEKQIDPMLSGISSRTEPKQSFESYRQERKTKQTDVSAIRGFVDYMQQAEYTININPHIKVFRELRQSLAYMKSEFGQSDLNSFLKYLDTYANHLAKKTTGFDRIFTDFFGSSGRTLLNGIEAVNNHIMKNAVIGNVSVAIKQVLNLKNGIFYLQNPTLLVNATLGYGKAVTSDSGLLKHYNNLFEKSNYLAERFLNLDFVNRKSTARKVAEKMVSVGDEFSVRCIWLAAYEDAVKLDVPDPVIYADDIARRCSAGRGIGEKPLAFTQQITKAVLPFLLENNNNWNVWRDFFQDTARSDVEDGHRFSDKNSYLYYKNRQKGARRVAGNSFKLAIFLLMTVGIGDLIEELTGYRAEFDPVNNIRKGFRQAMSDSGKFDFAAFFDGMLKSGKNMVHDFAEHRNFSSVYSAVLAYVDDDPLRSNIDFFGNVPLGSVINNVVKSAFVDKDILGAGMEAATSILMPFGGSQLKKTVKGIADVVQGAHYKEPITKSFVTAEKGGRVYDVKQSAGNFIRGALFGASALPESREYWNGKEDSKAASKEAAKIREEDFEAYVAQVKASRKSDKLSGELWRLRDETASDIAMAYSYVEYEQTYTDSYGNEQIFELSEKERALHQSEQNRLLKEKYAEVVGSSEYKAADDEGKLALLQTAREKVLKDYGKKIKNEYKMKPVLEAYINAHGEDEVIRLFRQSGNDYDILPSYEVERSKSYELNGEMGYFELTDSQIDKYNKQAAAELEKEYAKALSSHRWSSLSDEQKKEKLLAAKQSAADTVNGHVKWDYVYADAMAEFDAKYGEDNPVRRAYEASNDALVYPYWQLDDTFEFTYNKHTYLFEMNHDANSYGDTSEYEALSAAYNEFILNNYVKSAIGGGHLQGKSDEEVYELLTEFKSRVVREVNKRLKAYAIEKAKVAPEQFELKE